MMMQNLSKYSVFILLVLVIGVTFASKMQCTEIERCLLCKQEEILSDYCKETGRRVKISCKQEDAVMEDYKACQLSAEDEQLRLIVFQVIMAVVGGLAYFGVQKRKANSMSLFDTRRRQNQK